MTKISFFFTNNCNGDCYDNHSNMIMSFDKKDINDGSLYAYAKAWAKELYDWLDGNYFFDNNPNYGLIIEIDGSRFICFNSQGFCLDEEVSSELGPDELEL